MAHQPMEPIQDPQITIRNEQLNVVYSERRLSVYRNGQSEPLVVQQAGMDRRPYLHPLAAPDGIGILTEDAPYHHAWQHGLYVGLNRVNDNGFWTEGLTGNPKDGTFHPLPLSAVRLNNQQAEWDVTTVWKDSSGADLLLETQHWEFTDHGDTYELDLAWKLTAFQQVMFGQHEYGGLFLRMPYRPEHGGDLLNSEGHLQAEASEQRARWAAISMPIAGRSGPAGIAILDHVENPEYPSPWRVDGQLGISPSRCIAGEWSLPEGESTLSRYRVCVYNGTIDSNLIEASWTRFTGGHRT